MKLTFKNNTDKKSYDFNVTDLSDSGMFYHFDSITLPSGIPDGDYNYYLYDENDKLVAEGLCQIGTYTEHTKKYEKEEKDTFIQYIG